MAKKSGLSSACLNAIIEFSEQSAQYQDAMHNCQVHKNKTACKNAKTINKKVTGPIIDRMFNQCRR